MLYLTVVYTGMSMRSGIYMYNVPYIHVHLMIPYSQRHSLINHWDRRTLHLQMVHLMILSSQRHSLINHWDRRTFCITLLSDTDISVALFNIFIITCTFYKCILCDSKLNTLNTKEILQIYQIEQKIYISVSQWFIMEQMYVSDCTVE